VNRPQTDQPTPPLLTIVAWRDAVIEPADNSLGANTAISFNLGRLVAFDVAQHGADIIAVRVALPDLSARRTARLSPSARLAHERLGHSRLPAWPAAQPPATIDQPASPVGVSL